MVSRRPVSRIPCPAVLCPVSRRAKTTEESNKQNTMNNKNEKGKLRTKQNNGMQPEHQEIIRA